MPATTVIVTLDIAHVGMRVWKGPNWKYDSQNRNFGSEKGREVPGTIVEVIRSENTLTYPGVKVSWDKGLERVWYPADGSLVLWEEDKVEEVPDKSSYPRLPPNADVKVGDVLIGLPNILDNIFYYRQGDIKEGKLYTVTEVKKDYPVWNGRDTIIRAEGIYNNYFVGASCFGMHRQTNPLPPKEEKLSLDAYGYLSSTSGIKVGDKLVYGREWEDSSQANMEIGEEVTVTFVSHSAVVTNKKKDWFVSFRCFRLPGDKTTLGSLREEMDKTASDYKSAEDYDYEMIPVHVSNFGPKKRKRALTDPPRKSSPISSSIKTEENVRNTINTRGHIIKVCNSHLKIERGERIRGIIIQGRADKARIAGK